MQDHQLIILVELDCSRVLSSIKELQSTCHNVTLKGFKRSAVNWLVTNSVMTVHPWSPTGPWWPPWLVPWPPWSTFPYITPLDQHPFNWPPLLFIHPGFLTGGSFLHIVNKFQNISYEHDIYHCGSIFLETESARWGQNKLNIHSGNFPNIDQF